MLAKSCSLKSTAIWPACHNPRAEYVQGLMYLAEQGRCDSPPDTFYPEKIQKPVLEYILANLEADSDLKISLSTRGS